MSLPASADPMRARAAWAPLAAFVLAALSMALPILLHNTLPLVDLPNHIARHHVMATTSGPLLTYYQTSSAVVPNASADLLWRLTGFPGDPVAFSQRLMAAYTVLLTAAAMVLARTVHGRWTAWSAVAGLLALSSPFFMGFQNFVLALPFTLLGLALWVGSERRPLLLRLALLMPLATLIYLMHFFAFAGLAVAALGREVQRLLAAPAGARLRQAGVGLALGLTFLPGIAWLAVETLTAAPSPGLTGTSIGNWRERLEVLTWPLYAPSAPWTAPVNVAGTLAALALLAALLTLFAPRGPRLVLAPALKGPAVALLLLCAVTPMWLNGVALVQIRPPVLFLLILVAGTRWEGLSATQGRLVALLFAACLAARGATFERFIARNDADMADLATVLADLPPGARLLPLRSRGQVADWRLWHAQAYAVTWRDAFVPTLFQGVHALAVRPEWLASSHPALFAVDECVLFPEICRFVPQTPTFLQDWPHKYTHALLADPNPTVIDRRPEFVPLARSGRFTLYRIVPPAP